MKKILTLLAALTVCAAVNAQSNYADLIRENPDRAAGVHHSYEFIPAAETPAPRGYKPFYVSHYGRHGSRRSIGSSAERAYEYMSKAHEEGILTPKGEELYRMVWAIHEDHVMMNGELTARGGREHRAIAQRLYERVPAVWKSRKRTQVHVQSSNIPRCLVSMANFTSSLDDMSPRLLFDFITGDKYINLLAHDYYNRKEVSQSSHELLDSMGRAIIKPKRFMDAIFRADPSVAIPDTLAFVYQIYLYGGIRQCTETPDADIFGTFFTVDELIDWYRCYNSRTYNSMANSEEYGDYVIWAARDLVMDFVTRADEALLPGSHTAADLRFGHDSGILPLAGLIDLVGPGDRYPRASVSECGWQSFNMVPMGSNLQIIFYKKRGTKDPLVKLMYNERETLVRGLDGIGPKKGSSGPYYKWSELRDYLLLRVAAAEL